MNIVEKSLEFAKPKTTYADTLRFTAYAWSKFLHIQAIGNTEIAGYCITETTDPLLVTDFRLIKQQCSSVTFDLDENDIAEYQESMLDTGLTVWQACRILAHSHPGNCPNPSQTDEENFRKVFTSPDWAIMLIVADNGTTYCRLKVNVGPGVEKLLKVKVDFSHPFKASDEKSWDEEYKAKVTERKFLMTGIEGIDLNDEPLWNSIEDTPKKCFEDEWLESQIDQEEIDCFWDGNGDVNYWDDDEDVWYLFDPITTKWLMYDDEENVFEISRPNRSWASKVIEWAEKYAHERDAALPEKEVPSE